MLNIFIISLKCFVKRYSYATNLVKQENANNKYSWHIFDAIDAKGLDFKNDMFLKEHTRDFFLQMQSTKQANCLDYLLSIKWHGKELSHSEIACYYSHYLLWQKCIELQKPIVVLEDDVSLHSNFYEGLKAIQTSGFDYVRLMHLKNAKLKSQAKTKSLKPYFKQLLQDTYGLGAQGYFITPKAASRFIKASKIFVVPVDFLMDAYFYHQVPNIVYEPFLIQDKEEVSTITRIKDIKTLPKMIYFLHKLYKKFYKLFYDTFKT
ncbi:glycosyltransferase family 25 protein [Helicobacter cetorum]|uniref:Lipopolysaccharide biosynthesis protein n=1 Tax=Helicobacter cetorum (strain ATCC BAA-429 / MIT 00-7128) TaxID=182217 RepID=I0ENZ6_HELC0|nr:glycosyltransferase family 25 protein [Helicobacter cetorum]AFI04665.1 lipopolysaccharide biosynthesis protein [Helicobacter cetorum MIT 00-7128]